MGSGPLKQVFQYPFEFAANTASAPGTEAVENVLERLGLGTSLLKKDFSDLSTGQRQRVGIALCYLLNKPLVLLDEPTSALDNRSKQHVVDLLFGDTGRTILSTSHDPWWIEQCDKAAELN